MMKSAKKTCSLLLSLLFVISMIPFLSVPATAANKIVTLDPGHGSSSPGADGATQWGGLNEMYYNLDIANYTLERLRTYSQITAYMTKTTIAETPGLAERVQTAANYNSNAIVSIHNNSSTSSTPHGTQIFVPNPNYRRDMYTQSLAMANLIMKHMNNDAGTNMQTAPYYTNGSSTYPDGSVSDYYGILRNAKLQPSIEIAMIVECVFCSNQSDVQNFLMNPAKIKAMGYAIADGIAEYYGFTAEVTQTMNCIDYDNTGTVRVDEVVQRKVVIDKSSTSVYTLRGWSLHPDGIELFEYNINNTSWGTAANEYRADVTAAYPQYTKCTTVNGFSQNVDISGFAHGATKIYLRGRTLSGEYYDIAVVTVIIGKITPAAGGGLSVDRTQTKPVLTGVGAKTDITSLTAALAQGTYAVLNTAGDSSSGGYIGTGFTVQLIIEETVTDELTVIVTGDLTGDGLSNGKDIIRARKAMAQGVTPEYAQAVDFNNNGLIDGADISALVSGIKK